MSEVIEEVLEDEGLLEDCVEVQLEKLDLAAGDQKNEVVQQEPQAVGGWYVEPLPEASGGWDFSVKTQTDPHGQENKFEMSNAWGVTEAKPQETTANGVVQQNSEWGGNNQEQINQSNSGWNNDAAQTGWQAETTDAKQSESLPSAWGESWGGLAELPSKENESNQRGRGGGRGRGGPRVCFKCQQEGHMSRECPNQSTGQRKCFKCGIEGHTSRDCTEPGQDGGSGRGRGRGRGRGFQQSTDQSNEPWGQTQSNTEQQNSWNPPQDQGWQQTQQTNEQPNNSWGSSEPKNEQPISNSWGSREPKNEQPSTNSWGSNDIQVTNPENTWNAQNQSEQTWGGNQADTNAWGSNQPDTQEGQKQEQSSWGGNQADTNTWGNSTDTNAWGGNQADTNRGGGGQGQNNGESRENNRGRGRGRGRGGDSGGSRACFKCQQEGHMSRDCPNVPTQSRACFKCGKEGHMSRECTEPGQNSRGRGRGRGQPRENTESSNQDNPWGQSESIQQTQTVSWGQTEIVAQTETVTWGQPQTEIQSETVSWGQPAQTTNQTETVSWGQPSQTTNQAETVSWGQPIATDELNQPNTTENQAWGSGGGQSDWQMPTTSDENKPVREKTSKGCFKCGEEGHMSRECPKNEGQPRSKGCFKCGEEGHMSKECPKNDGQSKPNACFKCGEEGHMSKECPNKQVRKCFNCGSEDHLSKDCTQEQKLEILDGPGGACSKCGNYGHMARDCNGSNSDVTVYNYDDLEAVPLPRKKVKIGDPIEIVISDDDEKDNMIIEKPLILKNQIRLDTLDHVKQGIIQNQNIKLYSAYNGLIQFKDGQSIMCRLISYDSDHTFIDSCPPISFLQDQFTIPILKDHTIYYNQLIRLRQEERRELIRKQYMGVVQGVSEEDNFQINQLAQELLKTEQSIRISYGIFYSDITFFHIQQIISDIDSTTQVQAQLIFVVNLKPKFLQEHEDLVCYRTLDTL